MAILVTRIVFSMDYFVLVKKGPDIRNKIYFRHFGLARWPSLGTHWLHYIYINYIYLLLAEWEVRTASYGQSFFLPFMGHENKEGKKRGSITCRMD